MQISKLYNNEAYKNLRKKLRNSLTPSEASLWNYLKNSQLAGRKFRRQASIGNYIVDFYYPSEKIAIELDGQVHTTDKAVAYDKVRDTYLKSVGVKVLRFENRYVYENLQDVLKTISKSFT